MRIQELRAARAEKASVLMALVEKMNADGYVEQAADQKAFDDLKTEIEGIDIKTRRTDEANRLAVASALAVREQGGIASTFATRARYGKLKAFKDVHNLKGELVRADEQAYRIGKFLLATIFRSDEATQWCRDNGVDITKAQSEGVNSAGGVLVPEEWMNTIIDLREQFGVIRRESFVAPMGRDTLNWPRRTGGVTAFFVSEGEAPTESTANWDNVNLTAKKLAALIRMSTEISDDAIINVADWLTNEIAYAFASKEDDCGFNGDGTKTYGGIQGVTQKFLGSSTAGVFTATGHATFDALTATDIELMRALLPFYALPNAKIYCSQYAFAACFERLVAAGGGNSIATLNGEIVYRYLGTPIVISQKMVSTTPTGKIGIIYGDMAKAIALGERRQVSIKRSDDRYFDTDQVGIMGTERMDINAHDVGDGTTAGPLVALKMG